MKESTKEKVKAKVKAIKKRVKGKVKGVQASAKLIALFAFMAVVGCSTSDPASRQTYATYKIVFEFGDDARNVSVTNTLGDGALASADSKGSQETMTSSPSNEVKPDTNLEIPVNKSGGGAQSVGSVLGDAVADGVKSLLTSKDTASTQKDCGQCGKCDTCTDR